MIDIRAICKVFLDFVYKEEMLPIEIIKLIDENDSQNDPEYSVKWDIRVILNLLHYKEKYTAPKNTRQKTYKIQNEISEKSYLLSDRECDYSLRDWLLKNKRQFGDAIDFCNEFFHNVETDSGIRTFCENLRELITNSKMENAYDYIQKIDNIVKQSENNNTTLNTNFNKAQPITIKNESSHLQNATSNEWSRKTAKLYCCEQGCKISECFNYASQNKTARGEYWINAALEFVNYDWDIILDNQDAKCFNILHIPANTFKVNDFNIKTNKQGSKIDLYIDAKSFKDRKGINFKPYLVKTIKY